MPTKAEPRHHLIRKRDAAQATLDAWRDKPFRWGSRDCARMVASHLRRCGYRVKLPHSGAYASLNSARKAVAAAGYRDLPDALDALELERIPPAAAMAGDIIQWPSEHEGLAALGVHLGDELMVAYHPHTPGATILRFQDTIAAWRVEAK